MVSQLRLRAMAAGVARREVPPRPTEGARGAPPLNPTVATREAMRSIQASIEAHQASLVEDPEGAGGYGTPRVRQPTKRARTEATAMKETLPKSTVVGTQPANAVIDKRDGRTKIYVGGFEYTRATITRVKISYRCSFYRSQQCPAKLVFYASMMDYDFHNMVQHTCTPPSRAHPALDAGTKTLIVKAAMQREVDRLAVSSPDTPREIWEEVSMQFYQRDDDVVVQGMSKLQVTKRVHHVRAQHFGSDVHGRVEVPPLSRVRLTPLNFFQFHHVWTNMKVKSESKIDRVIGWAHPALLSLLRYAKITLFIDGTFRCVPTQFRQCVVVMVFDQGSKLYVPVFYVLAASKTYEAYWNILQYVSDACGERIDPQRIVCDFELALIQAVQGWFPDTDVVGCYFHFKQACSRRMAKLRIPKREIAIAMEKGVLDVLTVSDHASIEKDGIAWVRGRIKARCEEEGIKYSAKLWRAFWVYFRRTWIVLHPPAVWNVHGFRRDIVARTNNPLERFNRELNAAFSTPNPSTVRFVQTIEGISRRYVRLREEISRGIAEPPRREPPPALPTPAVFPSALDDDVDDDDERVTSEREDSPDESESESESEPMEPDLSPEFEGGEEANVSEGSAGMV